MPEETLPMEQFRMNGTPDFDKYFSQWDIRLDSLWTKILQSSPMASCVLRGEATPELYAIYLAQTYHYTSHNSRNQAMVGLRAEVKTPAYVKFCLEHARDEFGHEQMALHDIGSLGYAKEEALLPPPLPATETLIAYLYWISMTGNPIRRLGYSYWAESCYGYISPLIQGIKKTLNLTPAQMTFFLAHSEIDQEHFEQVKAAIRRTCKREAELLEIERVMEHSLILTGRIMDAAFTEYQALQENPTSRHGFLNRPA
jgi:pyrroloquinoline quinone (PQQ) biosynthesis protein C